jgi:hypothetical protein
MIRLLIQESKSKFMQNLSYTNISDMHTMNLNLSNNLYRLFYTHKFSHIVFKAELITQEIVQFIQDFSRNNVKMFIHHDKVIDNLVSTLSEYGVEHLSEYASVDQSNINQIPQNLLNTKLFNFDTTNNHRSDSIVCFIDDYPTIPEFLDEYLYPKTKLPIKLFNNIYIKHPQNLGLINEVEKAKILQNNKYYLSLGKNDYIREAQSCGAIVLRPDQLPQYTSVIYSAVTDYIEYTNFIKDIMHL